MIFYTFTFIFIFILYGKSFNFLILTYITPVVSLIMLRYKKLMILISLLTVILVIIINYFDFFGYDYGNKMYFKKDIYDVWYYFILVMITLYLITFLTVRTNLVSDIIEDLKTKNIQLEESRVELKKLQLNKESFFAIMCHEIRTPLNAIKGISDILKNKIKNDEDQNFLEILDYSTNHLLS